MSASPNRELLDCFRGCLLGRGTAIPARFLEWMNEPMFERRLEPHGLPCLSWLERVEEIADESAQPLIRFLREQPAPFRWGQTYRAADFGERFLRSYGWLEVFGARGHFAHRGLAGGLLLLGPATHYPDHHHIAEEIYIPLTGGTEWRAGDAPFARRDTGAVIHHPSNVVHAMRTGLEPLLALYLWRGGPLDQRSVIAAPAAKAPSTS